MRFESPEMLHLLWALPPAALLMLWSGRRRRKLLARLADLDLLPELAPSLSTGRRVGRALLLLAGIALVVLALAGPQWGLVEEEVRRAGIDVVLAVDTSLSMLAEDVRPSRLERARLEIAEFLENIRGDRVALVVFSSSAHVLVPLTLDVGVVDMFLDVLDTEITSGRGTSVGDAIEVSLETLSGETDASRAIVLVTDGEDHGGGALDAARRAADAGVRIYAVGVGSSHGEPIPMRDAQGRLVSYKEDREGHVVTSRLDEETLREIASLTGGAYFRLSGGASPLGPLREQLAEMQAREMEERMGRRYQDRFEWPLGAGLFLLLVRAAVPEARRDRRRTPRRTR